MRPHFLLSASLLLLAPPSPQNGEDLIREMHNRYAGKWYQTLTFVQKTTKGDGTVETWYEAARIPGFLRIDIAPVDSGNAILFRNDSVYVFRGGQRRQARPYVHPLMVLGFDVYADTPEKTIEKLKGLNFDLTRLREDSWQGRPVYVVGAAAGDTTSNQFWVDKERLLTVRLIQPGNGSSMESLFNKYQRIGNTWIAPEMIFNVNGRAMQTEEYSDMQVDVDLPEGLFEPGAYSAPGWVK